MSWTTEEKLNSLMRLPWTVTSKPADDPGEFVVRVSELPGLIVVGTPEEIDVEFWDALSAMLEVHLDSGDPIPLPRGVKKYPWETAARRQSAVVRLLGPDAAEKWRVERPSASTALAGPTKFLEPVGC